MSRDREWSGVAMIDCGSPDSFVAKDVQQALGANLEGTTRQYRAFNNSRVDIKGCITVDMALGSDAGREVVKFNVAEDASYPVIIGRNLLHKWVLTERRSTTAMSDATASICTMLREEDGPDMVPDDEEVSVPDMSGEDVLEKQLEKLPTEVRDVIREFERVFRAELDAVGCTAVAPMKINIREGSRPSKRMPYRRNPTELAFIEKTIKKLLERGIIEESHSEWGAPVVLVKKHHEPGVELTLDDMFRMCLDYRGVNAVTMGEVIALPRIEEVVDRMRGCSVFSKIDLKKGYWQLLLDKASRELTAFVTHMGQYQFTRVSMGLRTACQYFQRTMKTIMNGLEHCCDNHVDDIVIFSKDKEQAAKDLGQVLARLQAANLIVSIDKCQFMCDTVEWCGYQFSKHGVSPTSNKVEAISRIPYPKDATQMRSFLGVTNYYRRFIHDYAKKTANLTKLTREGETWRWTRELEADVDELKRDLKLHPVMRHPDYGKPFIVRTDASLRGIGATLEQVGEDGHLHPVAYMARALNKAQRNYAIVELECMALVQAVVEWRQYLSYAPFVAFTDHQPLTWIVKNKDTPNRRIQRWMMTLSEFECQVEYIKGESNVIPDALSRLPFSTPVIATIEETEDLATQAADDMITSQEFWECVVNKGVAIEHDNESRQDRKRRFQMQRLARMMSIDNLQLYHKNRRYVPRAERNTIIEQYHATGHFGADSTTLRILHDYWWPQVHQSVTQHIQNCKQCIDYTDRSLGSRVPHGAQHLDMTDGPGRRVHVDYTGPFPKTTRGHTGIFFFTDVYTSLTMEHVVREKSAKEASRGLIRWASLFGPPDELVSDQGREFLNDMVKKLCDTNSITRSITSGYHPISNGAAEKVNHILITAVRKFCDGQIKDWDEILPWVMFADRTRPRPQHKGYSPMYLMTGRDVSAFFTNREGMIDEEKDLVVKLDRIHHLVEIVHPDLARLMKKKAEKIRNKSEEEVQQLKIGAHVVLMKPPTVAISKMERRTTQGVYKITGITSRGNYVLETMVGKPVITPIHPSRIRLVGSKEATRRLAEGDPEEQDDDDDDVFEVELVRDYRRRRGKDEFLCKWLGLDEESWVAADQVRASDCILEYWQRVDESV
jgi:hypothetical protein